MCWVPYKCHIKSHELATWMVGQTLAAIPRHGPARSLCEAIRQVGGGPQPYEAPYRLFEHAVVLKAPTLTGWHFCWRRVGGCQNDGPFLDPYY